MIRNTWKTLLLFLPAALVLIGCATTIRLEAQRTPTLDITGINRVAVMPFTPAFHTSEFMALSNALTSQVTSRLHATNAFTMVSPSIITAARSRGDSIDSYVDALFTGRVTGYVARTTPRQERRHDRATGTTVIHTFYVREVEVSFEYYFVRARDGAIIGPVSRSGRTSIRNDNRHNLTSEITLAERIISNQLRHFHRDVAPYTIRVSRTLEREPDRALRPQMDAALAQVRGGNYVAARQSYVAIWESHGSIAAAINASILYEAVGETGNAVILMQGVFETTRAPRVNQVLVRLNRELAEQAGVEALDEVATPVERVASHAIREVGRVLPATARVWVHNNSMVSPGMANDVIDTMISSFLSSGIPVVERQWVDLILAEQNLHLDGSVSDSDFVSVGNLAGANTIIVVGITGTGAARRLQVRVLDIATGTVIMQSGTGSEWQL